MGFYCNFQQAFNRNTFLLQLNYNGKILYNRHQVLRNDGEKLLLGQHTFGARQHTNRHTGTKYTAGVFRLYRGDRISVSGMKLEYTFTKDSAYFGTYLLTEIA